METQDNQFFAVSAPFPNYHGTQGDFLKSRWTFNLVLLLVFILAEDRGRDAAACNQSTRHTWLRAAFPVPAELFESNIWNLECENGVPNFADRDLLYLRVAGKRLLQLRWGCWVGKCKCQCSPWKAEFSFVCLICFFFNLTSFPVHYENLKSFVSFCWCYSDPELSMKTHGFLKFFGYWIAGSKLLAADNNSVGYFRHCLYFDSYTWY